MAASRRDGIVWGNAPHEPTFEGASSSGNRLRRPMLHELWLTSASARPLTSRPHSPNIGALNFMTRPPVCAPSSVNDEERR